MPSISTPEERSAGMDSGARTNPGPHLPGPPCVSAEAFEGGQRRAADPGSEAGAVACGQQTGRYRDIGWWYWLVTDLALVWALTGAPYGFVPVIALNVVQVAHYLWRERDFAAFPVQVRVAYLGLLLLGLWGPLRFVYWIQLAGTTAMVCFDYCPLARVLSLMPWNRGEPLSVALVRRTVLAPPVRGTILQGLPAE
jgi:hypothetical protein